MISIIFILFVKMYMALLITFVFAPPVAILVLIYFIGLLIYYFKDIKKEREEFRRKLKQ